MSEISNKLYRVIYTDVQLESLGVSVGDICTLKESNSGGTAWFHNEAWDDDGIWCLGWSRVEELTETN